MKLLFAIYLVFFKGYSVIRLCEDYAEQGPYGACNSGLDFNYSHNGTWGQGGTATLAVIDCWKRSRLKKRKEEN